MKLRLTIPSTLAMTLVCSCHGGGQHPPDATPLGDARVGDAAPDTARSDAPVDGALLADAANQPDALFADAAIQPDATVLPDAGVIIDARADARADAATDAAIDAIPDADLA